MMKHYVCKCGGELRIYWDSLEMECLRCKRPRPNYRSRKIIKAVHEAVRLDEAHAYVLSNNE